MMETIIATMFKTAPMDEALIGLAVMVLALVVFMVLEDGRGQE